MAFLCGPAVSLRQCVRPLCRAHGIERLQDVTRRTYVHLPGAQKARVVTAQRLQRSWSWARCTNVRASSTSPTSPSFDPHHHENQHPREENDDVITQAVRLIHAAPILAVLYMSGGASQATGTLISVEGSSSTVLEVAIPYSCQSMADLLGREPEQSVSLGTARQMARQAYVRAVNLTPPGQLVVGIAATCALVSTRPKKGEHRCVVVAYTSEEVLEYQLVLSKGSRNRYNEDHMTSQVVLQALADASQVTLPTNLIHRKLIPPGSGENAREGDKLEVTRVPHTDALDALLKGEEHLVEFSSKGMVRGATRARVLLPGSFNPLHEGHSALLASAAAMRPGREVAFELSVRNADKGWLAKEQVLARVQQFVKDGSPPVVCTDAPLYVAKARLLPNTTFVVGMDTAQRLVMPKYYLNGSKSAMVAALAEIKMLKCDFLVAGRLIKDTGEFEELDRLEVPEGLEGLFHPMPNFRNDMSSTFLRERGDGPEQV